MSLPNPTFGNTWKLVLNTRTHRTMGGNIRVLQGNAPVWQGFSARFIGVKGADIDAFRTFISQNAGQLIKLTDFEGRQWQGIITSPNVEIIKGKEYIDPISHVRNRCNYECAFDFEGNILS